MQIVDTRAIDWAATAEAIEAYRQTLERHSGPEQACGIMLGLCREMQSGHFRDDHATYYLPWLLEHDLLRHQS